MTSGRFLTFGRRRRILDQLQQFVTEDHPTRRGRQSFADLERALIHHRRHAAVFGEIIEVILQPGPQASAAGIHEFAHRRRVGQHCIGGGDRIDQDFRDQMRPRLVDVAQARLVDEAANCIAPGKIGLEHPAVQCTLLPGGIGKSSVACLRRTLGFAGDDRAEFAEEREPLLGGDLRLVDDSLEQDAGTVGEILPPDADKGIERQRISGCIFEVPSTAGTCSRFSVFIASVLPLPGSEALTFRRSGQASPTPLLPACSGSS